MTKEAVRSVGDMTIRIAIITNIIPKYREGFYDRLFSRGDILATVYCQERIPGMNVETISNKFKGHVKQIKNITARYEKISWQFVPWKEVISRYDVVFVGGNPRVLSDVLLAMLLKLVRKNMVLWTMAHSHRGNRFAEFVRISWTRLFDFILVYTDAEVDYLYKKGFKKKYILGINNGLDQAAIDKTISQWSENRIHQWLVERDYENRTLVLSCARLNPKNGFDLVVQALPRIIKELPNILWCIIGSGPELINLKNMISTAGLEKYVHFIGELYQESELAPWFLSSKIFIHPSAIGLSLMHSFGYGLPVVTSDRAELHGPEYAAFKDKFTGRAFRANDVKNLSEIIINLLTDNDARARMKSYVQKVVREQYNVDVMVNRFVGIAKRTLET